MAENPASTTSGAKTATAPCGVCGKTLSTPSSLKRHLAQVHRATDDVAGPAGPAFAPPAPVPPPPPVDEWRAPYAQMPWSAPVAAAKPFYTKKRYYVPAAVVAALMVIGTVSPDPDTTKSAKTVAVATPDPRQAALDQQAAEKAAADKAAADKAAAEKRAADAKAAAEKAAAEAKAAAARAAAEKAAAAKAAAEKAARERPVALTPRAFALVVKNPDAYVGKHYIVYGEVTQFDSVTGDSIFRADAGATRDPISYGYTEYDANTLFVGDPAMLANVVEGDVFRATVEVLGSESYTTMLGGETTVPKFRLQSISVYGSTK